MTEVCQNCSGTGRVEYLGEDRQMTCPACEGTGKMDTTRTYDIPGSLKIVHDGRNAVITQHGTVVTVERADLADVIAVLEEIAEAEEVPTENQEMRAKLDYIQETFGHHPQMRGVSCGEDCDFCVLWELLSEDDDD